MFNYENFIEYLKTLESTEEIVIQVYNYFKNNVKYDYDMLQWHKIHGAEKYGFEKLIKLKEKYQSIRSYNEENFDGKINQIDFEKEKEYAIKVLDEAFLELEKRPLADEVKKKLFENWGKIEIIESKSRIINPNNPDGKPYKLIKLLGGLNKAEIVFPQQFVNNLLISGVCEDYANWMNKICNDLNIPSFKVKGKGTANHSWNLIYIKEQDKWVHFDMTCVRFYLDNFTKDFGEPDKWVFASTEDIFKMQPKREIHTLVDYDGNKIFEGIITRVNYNEFENFEMNELCNKLGRSK